MTTDDAAADVPTVTATRRELAVARALDQARTRAENRVQLFLDAALELMNSNSGEFTVQEVTERSGQSLRTFYQYFAGKHELLLALFEDSIRAAALHLEDVIAEGDDPLDRLHRFAVEYYRMCRLKLKGQPSRAPGPMVEFGQQLLTSHPDEAARAFAPLVVLLEDLLAAAAAAGDLRPGLDLQPDLRCDPAGDDVQRVRDGDQRIVVRVRPRHRTRDALGSPAARHRHARVSVDRF